MPNARPTPGLRLTPEKHEQLRGLAEAVEHGTAPFITYEADLAARAFREIERLRADLEQLEAARAEAARYRQRYEALLDRIEELEDVLRKLYADVVVTHARYCGECGLEPGRHGKGCMMAEVERVLGLEGGSHNV